MVSAFAAREVVTIYITVLRLKREARTPSQFKTMGVSKRESRITATTIMWVSDSASQQVGAYGTAEIACGRGLLRLC